MPFSDHMKLAAGGGGTILIDEDVDESKIVVHGSSLGLKSNKGLQAFRVGGDSMEPLIAEGGIVLADLKQNNIMHIRGAAFTCYVGTLVTVNARSSDFSGRKRTNRWSLNPKRNFIRRLSNPLRTYN